MTHVSQHASSGIRSTTRAPKKSSNLRTAQVISAESSSSIPKKNMLSITPERITYKGKCTSEIGAALSIILTAVMKNNGEKFIGFPLPETAEREGVSIPADRMSVTFKGKLTIYVAVFLIQILGTESSSKEDSIFFVKPNSYEDVQLAPLPEPTQNRSVPSPRARKGCCIL